MSFQNFGVWFDANYIDNYELDKDILSPREKVYSPDTCIFLPPAVNYYINIITKILHNPSIGVNFIPSTGKYRARCTEALSSNRIHLGVYSNKEDATRAYVTHKLKQNDKVINYLIGTKHYSDSFINTCKDKLNTAVSSLLPSD